MCCIARQVGKDARDDEGPPPSGQTHRCVWPAGSTYDHLSSGRVLADPSRISKACPPFITIRALLTGNPQSTMQNRNPGWRPPPAVRAPLYSSSVSTGRQSDKYKTAQARAATPAMDEGSCGAAPPTDQKTQTTLGSLLHQLGNTRTRQRCLPARGPARSETACPITDRGVTPSAASGSNNSRYPFLGCGSTSAGAFRGSVAANRRQS